MNLGHPLTIRRIEMIKTATTDRALSAIEIGDAVFLHHISALDYARNLLANKSIHIESWRTGPGLRVAMYRWGSGVNKPRPRARNPVESERARMARVRKDPEAYGLYLSKQRARYAKERAVKSPNSWFGALPGSRSIQGGAA